ncbi:MAG: transglutaminase-like domain-containing protein [Pirellulales bacterium]|nr:transglutaminase-like domain-containing protein [Pirellulales bacterium]
MTRNISVPTALSTLLLAVCSGLWGCGDSTPVTATEPENVLQASDTNSEAENRWMVSMLNGSKIAHVRTSLVHHDDAPEGNSPGWTEEAEIQMSVDRFGQQAAPSASYRGQLTANGQLLSFECTTRFGKKPQRIHGKWQAGQLEIKHESGETTTIKCPEGCGGFLAVDLSLRQQPLKAGEKRTVTHYDAVTGSLAREELHAKTEEETQLLDGKASLLRIEQTTHLDAENAITQVIWSDIEGNILKSQALNTGSEQYVVSKEQALAKPETSLDLAWATSVPVSYSIADAHQTLRVRYRVHLEAANPSAIFPEGAGQTVTPIDEHSADLIVKAVRPMPFVNNLRRAGDTPPTAADVQPNAWIQSDDARVINLAESVALDEVDSWKVAQALERLVHDSMHSRNFNTAMASAAEVVQTREGDCTEHAVLLAAVLRARQIPARVAVGLVHTESLGGFGFHMWNEAFIHGAWVPLDATLGRGGTGAGHIRLNSVSLAGSGGLASLLPVAQVMGQLKIDVLEVE